MNRRLKSVFLGVTTGLAFAAILMSGPVVFEHLAKTDEGVPAEPSPVAKKLPQKFSDEQVKTMTLTDQEVQQATKYFALQTCVEAGRIAIQGVQGMTGGAFTLAESPQEAFNRHIQKCEQDTGMTVEEADSVVGALETKYGGDLERVYQNSISKFQRP